MNISCAKVLYPFFLAVTPGLQNEYTAVSEKPFCREDLKILGGSRVPSLI